MTEISDNHYLGDGDRLMDARREKLHAALADGRLPHRFERTHLAAELHEKYSELELILRHAEKLGVRPLIGMRVKLAAQGSGRWRSSGGYRSKFGLTVAEILRAFGELEKRGMADCLKLLHFHLGSQITNIRQVKGAINEAVRV